MVLAAAIFVPRPTVRRRAVASLATVGLLWVMSGCAAPAIEAVDVARDRAIAERNLQAAEAGDAKAQFAVGKAYCCSTFDRQPFYDTKASIRWLCRSAKQGYGPAMTRLARIYVGDTVDGVRILRRASALVASDTHTDALAWTWFRLAEAAGEKDATHALDKLTKSVSQADRLEGEKAYAQGLANAPCSDDAFTGR